MSIQSELLTEIEAFLTVRGDMAETTFGKLAVNDGKLVSRLRVGRNVTVGTIERTRQFLREQQAALSVTQAAE
jgi:glycerol-3-phosphate dehydrogenase